MKNKIVLIYSVKDQDYAKLIKKIIYPELEIKFDKNQNLDGVKRKIMDSINAFKYGLRTKTNLRRAIHLLYTDIFNKKFDEYI